MVYMACCAYYMYGSMYGIIRYGHVSAHDVHIVLLCGMLNIMNGVPGIKYGACLYTIDMIYNMVLFGTFIGMAMWLYTSYIQQYAVVWNVWYGVYMV